VPAFAGVLLGEKSNFLRKIDNWLKQNPAYASPIKKSKVKSHPVPEPSSVQGSPEPCLALVQDKSQKFNLNLI